MFRPLVTALLVFVTSLTMVPSPLHAAGASASYGIKYSFPSGYFTGCDNYTWLHGANYTSGCGGSVSPKQELSRDLAFAQSAGLGSIMRVWVSLDELFSCFNPTTGFCGYDSTSLANLDDALHQFAAHGIRVELGLLVWESGCSTMQYCFHPEALDGNHDTMQSNYLIAVWGLAAHIAADPLDTAAVAVLDTQSEAYYQDETYLATHLGKWAYAMPPYPAGTQCYVLGNTVCTGGSAGHGCLSGSGVADNACMDTNIIEPWLARLHSAIKQASSALTVTVGDTGRLLTTDTGTYTGQSHWMSLYSPVADVYDIHLYENDPWDQTARWVTWTNLDKPYFVGEAGCAGGTSGCTYNTGPISAPLQWWLDNMVQHYGAKGVMVENRGTVWTFGTGPTDYHLTPSGQYLQMRVAQG